MSINLNIKNVFWNIVKFLWYIVPSMVISIIIMTFLWIILDFDFPFWKDLWNDSNSRIIKNLYFTLSLSSLFLTIIFRKIFYKKFDLVHKILICAINFLPIQIFASFANLALYLFLQPPSYAEMKLLLYLDIMIWLNILIIALLTAFSFYKNILYKIYFILRKG